MFEQKFGSVMKAQAFVAGAHVSDSSQPTKSDQRSICEAVLNVFTFSDSILESWLINSHTALPFFRQKKRITPPQAFWRNWNDFRLKGAKLWNSRTLVCLKCSLSSYNLRYPSHVCLMYLLPVSCDHLAFIVGWNFILTQPSQRMQCQAFHRHRFFASGTNNKSKGQGLKWHQWTSVTSLNFVSELET